MLCEDDYCNVRMSFAVEYRVKNVLFLNFSPLWGNIYPYINRGRSDGTSDKAETYRLVLFLLHYNGLTTGWGSILLSRQKPVRDMARVSP